MVILLIRITMDLVTRTIIRIITRITNTITRTTRIRASFICIA